MLAAGKGADGPSPLLSTSETHLKCWLQFSAPNYERDMDILESVQQGVTTLIKGLEHLTDEEGLTQVELFRVERRRHREVLGLRTNT